MPILDNHKIVEQLEELIQKGERLASPDPKYTVSGDIAQGAFIPWRVQVLTFLTESVGLRKDHPYISNIDFEKEVKLCVYKDRDVDPILGILRIVKKNILNSEPQLSDDEHLHATIKPKENLSKDALVAALGSVIRGIQECGTVGIPATFPSRVKRLFEYVEEEAKNNPNYKEYEESMQKWKGWLKEEDWTLLNKPKNKKQLAYTLYKMAAYSNDNGRKGGIIDQFSKQGAHQPNISRFNNMLLQPFKEALEDILCAKPESLEGNRVGESSEGMSDNSVFIVHGRDSNAMYQLKDLLRDWRLRPIILHEQPNRGRVIIEKFEDHSEEVRCAIVLLTPDDKGCLADTNDWRPRARQNVIFEFGYFFAKLDRGKVICLHKGDIELPSDVSGIIYIPFESDLKKEVYSDLRRELKAIGFTISD